MESTRILYLSGNDVSALGAGDMKLALAAYGENGQFIGLFSAPEVDKFGLQKWESETVNIVVKPNGKEVYSLKAILVNADGSWTPLSTALTVQK